MIRTLRRIVLPLFVAGLLLSIMSCSRNETYPTMAANPAQQEAVANISLPLTDITPQVFIPATENNKVAILPLESHLQLCPPMGGNSGDMGKCGKMGNDRFGFGRILNTVFGKNIPFPEINRFNKAYMDCMKLIMDQMRPLMNPIVTKANADRRVIIEAYNAAMKTAKGITDKAGRQTAVKAARTKFMTDMKALNDATQAAIAAIEAQFADAKCRCFLTFLNNIRSLIPDTNTDGLAAWDKYVAGLKLPCNTSAPTF